jgi:sterol 3beta-glucosyltransferase
MIITIPTAGTRGDVQPAIALGLGLKKAGYRVRLVAFEEYRSLVADYGLDFFPLQVNMQSLLEKHGKANFFEPGSTQIFFIPLLIRLFNEMYEQTAIDILAAASGSSTEEPSGAIVGNPATSTIAFAVAEKLGACYIETSGFPGWVTRSFPSIFWPWISSPSDGGGWRGAYNRLTYAPFGWMANIGMTPAVNRCRKKVLGLPPLSPSGSFQKRAAMGAPALAHFSAHILPPPVDWPSFVHVTGYFFLDTPAFTPSPELQRFLEADPPPVYIGFGSMPSRDPAQMARLVTKALRLAGRRGLLLADPGLLGEGLAKEEIDQDILAIGSIPHDWLFPRCAAVVHHGGAGTTAAGLRAGVPSILVPILADQLLWARRIEDLGVGPKSIPRAKLTADRLAEAIIKAVTDRSMRQHAAELGEKIRSEDGVGNAVEIIDNYIKNASHSR